MRDYSPIEVLICDEHKPMTYPIPNLLDQILNVL